VLALVLWAFLFYQPVDVAPPRYPTLEAAKATAVHAGGRHRWPGTAVRVQDVDPQHVEVERRWLGLRESVIRVEETQGGWDVGSAEAGPAHALQVFLGSVVPGLVVGWLLADRLRRRAALRRSAEAAPGTTPARG
jgi:hypothetical protein